MSKKSVALIHQLTGPAGSPFTLRLDGLTSSGEWAMEEATVLVNLATELWTTLRTGLWGSSDSDSFDPGTPCQDYAAERTRLDH